ncbi:MAG: prolyl oligopeptidase family serine peptidase [Nannocystales bacterium]
MRRAALLSTMLLGACRPAPNLEPPREPPPPTDTPIGADARDEGPTSVSTSMPSDRAAEIRESAYDPSADPRNTGGWVFSDDRDPAARDDAKRKPFSIDALYQLKSVGSPVASPDGQSILFTVTRHNLAKGKSNTDIHVVRRDGSGMRRLTRNAASDGSPAWLPDGKSFVFVSSREGGAQLWRMSVDGGEPEQLTHLSTGVGGPKVSPDGSRVAFTSSVFPEHGADDEANAKALEAREDNQIKAHVADDLLYRHWTSYDDGRRTHILSLDLATEKVIDLTPGDFHSPSFGAGAHGFAWSPDSAEVCFVSNRDVPSKRSWSTNKDLFVVSAKGGRAANITDSNEAYDGDPVYSPDGRYIAFRRQNEPGYEADRFRLALYDRKSGDVSVLTESFDNWVTGIAWADAGTSVVFQAAQKGRTPLFRVGVDGGDIKKLSLPAVRAWDVAADGSLAFTFTSIGKPVELFTADKDGDGARRLTGLNDAVAQEFDIRPPEEVWVEGKNGRKIHMFVVKPHGFRKGKRYPLILNVHGGPQSQWQDSLRGDWQVYPGAGYVVAFPNPTGSTGYGQATTAGISEDWGGKVYEDVMAAADFLEKQPYVDPKRMGAMGWSYGGYMMNWLLGHTDRFKAIASMMGIYELESFYGATEELWFPEKDFGGPSWKGGESYTKFSPSAFAKNFKTPTLIVTGELDYRVPYTQSLQLFTALRRQDVPSRLVVFPNDGHWPSHVRSMPLYYASHLDWFHRYLGGKASPYEIEALVEGTAFSE